jgi:hypothetical protein
MVNKIFTPIRQVHPFEFVLTLPLPHNAMEWGMLEQVEERGQIGILRANQDKFIRRGYYGGHTNVYIPYGENLHYYDVSSLYPFSMLQDMPGGTRSG